MGLDTDFDLEGYGNLLPNCSAFNLPLHCFQNLPCFGLTRRALAMFRRFPLFLLGSLWQTIFPAYLSNISSPLFGISCLRGVDTEIDTLKVSEGIEGECPNLPTFELPAYNQVHSLRRIGVVG